VKILNLAYLTSYRRRKDKSVSISFVTQEIPSEQILNIDKLMDSFGVLYFRAGQDIYAREVEELDSVEIEDKKLSKSKRLRNVLYRRYEQTNQEVSFNEYYSRRMEELIQAEKDLLDSFT